MAYTYKDVLEAENPKQINEASLSRVWQHLESGRSWGIISAWRGAYEALPDHELRKVKSKNKKRTDSLESDLSSMGYGYIPLKGRYAETVKTEEGETIKRWVQERSFFVPKITKDDITKLADKYNQDAVIFGQPDKEGEVVMLSKNGNIEFTLGPNDGSTLRPRKVSDAYSKVKGHGFTFGEKPPGGVQDDPKSPHRESKKLEKFHFVGVPHNMAEKLMESYYNF